MNPPRPEITYVLPDKMGGVFNYVVSLLKHRRNDGCDHAAILSDNVIDPDTRTREPLPADRVATFQYSLPPENVYAVLARLNRLLPRKPGVILANSWIELALATAFDTGRAVVAITHGDGGWYYDVARTNDAVIDAYITYTARMETRLREMFPERGDTIALIPYGVDIPSTPRAAETNRSPLRLLYVGRLSRDKGVFDLPEIAAELKRRGIPVRWTIQGGGPNESELRRLWPDPEVVWNGVQPMDAVLCLYRSHDVLVMPCRAEGLPVALLEAGASGVVPVISNLASGIPEVVENGVTGYRPEPGDIAGFVNAIAALASSRAALEAMSGEVRRVVASRYDADTCTAKYQDFYAHVMTRRKRWIRRPLPYGSRLDQPWIPNVVSKTVRRWMSA
jgi:glycosyltransferase involved in cell wall biosynthesis